MATKSVAIVPAGAIDLFSPSEVACYEIVAADLATVQTRVEAMVIKSQDQATSLHDGLAEVKRLTTTVDEARKKQVGPLNDQVKAINNAWRPFTDALDKLEQTAKRKLIVWTQQERERVAREQEAARKRQEEAAREEAEALRKANAARNSRTRANALEVAAAAGAKLAEARLAEPMDAPTGIRTDHGTTSLKAVWTFKVTDPTLVPRNYLAVDEKAIRAAVADGVRDIPGVAIYQEEQLATRVG